MAKGVEQVMVWIQDEMTVEKRRQCIKRFNQRLVLLHRSQMLFCIEMNIQKRTNFT